MPETDVLGAFLSRLLTRAAIVMGDLAIDREEWWIELRPAWPDVIRLRYTTKYGGRDRRYVEWTIQLHAVFALAHEDQTDQFIDRHLREFKRRVLNG